MSYGQMKLDFERGVDIDRMTKERVEKVHAGLKKYGLSGILTLDMANIRYIVNSRPIVDHGGQPGDRYALLPADAEPTLFEGGINEGPGLPRPRHWFLGDRAKVGISCGAANSPTELGEAQKMQLRKFAKQMKDELKAYKIVNETLGVVPFHKEMVGALEEAGIKVDLDRASNIMRECREVKTEDEVECLRIACAISEACTEKVKQAIKPGVRENELVAIAAYHAYRLGAEGLVSFHVESGQHTWPNPFWITDKIVRPGELINMEIAVAYLGYRNCYYTGTFSVGQPTQAQKDAFEKAREWQLLMAKAIRAGGTTKDVAEKMPSFKEFGYPDEDSSLMMQWSHGIGLSTPEWPSIHRAWSLEYPYPIKEGMCLAIETIWPTNERSPAKPNGEACRIEDNVHVIAGGLDWLTQWPHDEIMVCEY
nr:Xaa-Pro peptidase family protein [Candidatus Njordarchaeum guaymaensis]